MRRFRRQIQSVGVHEAFIDGAWRRCSCIWFHRQTRLQAQEWLRMEATPGALSSTTPSWEVAIGPDTHCGDIYLAQAATCRLDVVCLSAPRVLLVYGDKTERQGLTGGLLGWNKVVCQSTGWDWMEISPQGVHIDLERKLKKKKKSCFCTSSFIWRNKCRSSICLKCTNRKWQQSCLLCGRQPRGKATTRWKAHRVLRKRHCDVFPCVKNSFSNSPKSNKRRSTKPGWRGLQHGWDSAKKIKPALVRNEIFDP